MKKTFKVERNGKQTWVVVRQMPHDTQYAVGSRIPGLGRVIEIRATEEGPYLPCSYCGSTFHQLPCPYEPVAPQWMGTEPCYAAETNAHISAFFARNCMRLIESVAAKSGIDLQAEMRKSEAVERNLAELRRFALLTPCQKVAEFEGYDR
ncbi:MAG: hypothetical protein WBX38_09120 [Candidatus Sulfotelmatobacter sp.]